MSDSSSSPPEGDSPSPPSPNSNSSPPTDNSNDSPPSPSSNSSPSPPSESNSSPPSSNATPSPPDSSPSPPQDDSSSSPPPPPPPESDSSSPPPPNLIVSPPPPSGSSPPSDDPPPSPAVGLQPPSDSSESPSDSSTRKAPRAPKDSSHNERNSPESKKNSPSRHSPSSLGDSSDSGASETNGSDSGGSNGNGIIIGLAIVAVVVLLLAIFFVSMKRRRRRLDALDYRPPTHIAIRPDGNYYRPTQTSGGAYRSDSYHGASGATSGSSGYGYHSGPQEPAGHAGSKSWFSYEELMDVTNGFSHENIIGEGGFGCVYKGTLSDGRLVAVKQLKAGSGQGEREFQAEVEIISRVHHRHLVSLVGYCIVEHHRLLVYEFLPNNTLEHHLHGKGLPPLEWSKRMKIAFGSAKGLAYLHEDCHPRIIHRDIKSANILLEDSFEPQVADFGLAKLSNDTHTHVSTRVMGTFGYLAPEYASSGKLTDRSDVFSFGVVLLELITGRKPVDSTRPYGDGSLVEWARPLLIRALETGNCDELVDPKLENNYNKTEMFNMIEAAAACVRHSAAKRPRMVQVVRALDSQDDMPDLTNGVKYGQSQAFNPGQTSADMQKFRQMAFGNDTDTFEYDSGEYDRRSAAYSGEFRSREHKPPQQTSPNYESDTRPMFRSERSNNGGGNYQYGGRGFL